ncbi:MAG: hypothetical protein Q9191_005418 [Dirinaria sp. TL-2023a]
MASVEGRLWIGDNGLWSSFALRTGTPPTLSYVLPSSASTQTWVVAPIGCEPSDYTADNCTLKRGGIVNVNGSSTWHEEGNYGLVLETNLDSNYDDVTGHFGLDTVSLGASNTTKYATLEAQVVAAISSNMFYTGFFGLSNQPTNFTTLNNHSHPSFLASLKTQNLIPSLSWSYTAGAHYRNSFGSLTFGGYDASQFEPNDVSFSLAPDSSRDLVVGLNAISTTSSNGSIIPLLSTPTLAFIDSTIPFLYLPPEVCDAFANTFNLKWDNYSRLYLIDSQTHSNMTAVNPNVTLTIGDSNSGGPTVDIVMPYSSFNLTAAFPFYFEADTVQYFPLRPAQNDSQYALGRTFLQDAYLITNYEHSNFSVSQARHSNATQASLIPIAAATPTSSPPINPPIAPAPTQTHFSHHGLSQTALAGTIAGTIAAVVLILIGLGLLLRRLRSQTNKGRGPSVEKSQIHYVFEKQELDGTAFTQPRSWYGCDSKDKRAELTNIEVVELPDQPVTHEIMSRPRKPWTPRRGKKSHNRKYNAYINIKKARDNRMSNGNVSPPISNLSQSTNFLGSNPHAE